MIENYKYTNKKISDWSKFIESVLESINYKYIKDYKKYQDYYLAFNPLIDDKKSMSCQFHIKDGILLMYNGSIEIERKNKIISSSSITPSEYSRLLNQYDKYIDFILYNNNINLDMLKEYKRNLLDKILNNFKFNVYIDRGMENFRKFLFYNFITDKDILQYNANKETKKIIQTFKKPEKEIFKKNIFTLEKPLKFGYNKIKKYINSRGIDFSENVYPVVIKFNGEYSDYAICFEYPNKFKKLRFINNTYNKRYMALSNEGEYDYFFEAKKNGSNFCFLVEGEIEGLTISKLVKDDVYCMHNVNSLPKYLNQLEKYDKIYVKVDFDKYEDVKKSFTRLTNLFGSKVTISPKIICQDKKIDYNYLYINNELNENIIYNTIIYKNK